MCKPKAVAFFCALVLLSFSLASADTQVGPMRCNYCVAIDSGYWSMPELGDTSHARVGIEHLEHGTTTYRVYYQWMLPEQVIPAGSIIDSIRIQARFDYAASGGFYITRIDSDITPPLNYERTWALWLLPERIPPRAQGYSNHTFDSTYRVGRADSLVRWFQEQFDSRGRFTIAFTSDQEYNIVRPDFVLLTVWVHPMLLMMKEHFENSNVTPFSGYVGWWDASYFYYDHFWEWGGEEIPYTLDVKTTQTFQADTSLETRPIIPPHPEKYHHWDALTADVLNHRGFYMVPTDPLHTANLKQTTDATLQAELMDVGVMGAQLLFTDPWFRDSTDSKGLLNRGMNAVPHSVPYSLSNLGIYSERQGVFLNEGSPPEWRPPYYTVGAPNPNTFTLGGQNYQAFFQGWAGNQDNIDYQNSSMTETPVVFKQPGAAATAMYKAHLYSSSSSALASNSQRKIVRDSFGGYHMTYPSGGSVWYCRSTDDGTTWAPELRLNTFVDPSVGSFGLPSIAFIPGSTHNNSSLMVVYEAYDAGESGRGLCYCELNLNGEIVRREESMKAASTSVAGMAPGIGVGRTFDHITQLYTYYPIMVWYCPDFAHNLLGLARVGGNWYEGDLGNLTDVSQFSVAPFCYRSEIGPEWDIAYVQNNTLYYASISLNGFYPTLGTPELVTAGGTDGISTTPQSMSLEETPNL